MVTRMVGGGDLKSLLCSIALLAVVAACAGPARTDLMVPETQRAMAASEDSRMHRAIALTDVGGGEETTYMPEVGSEEFREALRRALEAHEYLSLEPANAPYQLKAFIIEVRHPRPSISTRVDSFVRYTLLRTADGHILFDDVVHGTHTVAFDESFAGMERVRLAEEGAMRDSISALLERLRSL